ncbi:MAG TPA: type II secretion system protein GspN [Nitrospirae bacterium]|nr:type II secretion system protein GspN [Nitrospirota bacterium]
MIKTVKIIFLAVGTFLLILFLLWNIAIPEEVLLNIITENSKTPYNHITFEELNKGYFFDITSKKANIFYGSLKEPLLIVEDVNVYLNLFSLLSLIPTVHFAAKTGEATLKGFYEITGNNAYEILVNNFQIAGHKGLNQINIEGKGLVNIEIKGQSKRGDYKITVNQMQIKPILRAGVMVPFDKFDNIRGIGGFQNGVLYVKSLTFNGKGIQALAKGSVSKNKLDMTIEIIATKDVSGYQFLDIALNKYKKSEGFYVVPLGS